MSKNSASGAYESFRTIFHDFAWGKKRVERTEADDLVLIVDDDDMVRRCLVRLIRASGYRARAYSSAEEFLCAEETDDEPMCLLLDATLPGMSGLELQHRLVAESRCTPIIFMSAHDEPSVREQALRTGAIAFLFKPFNAEALLCALEPLSTAPGKPTSRDDEAQSFAEQVRRDDPVRTSCQPEGGTIQKPIAAAKS